MINRIPSFSGAWHSLTSTPQWTRAVCLLAVCAWIPVLGPILLFGYGLEWARRIAWGSNQGPKVRSINWNQMCTTGLRAYGVSLTLELALALIADVIFHVPFGWSVRSIIFGTNPLLYIVSDSKYMLLTTIIITMIHLLVSTFVLAAMLRATLYDSFAAGWRLDRICQMIGRDVGAFVRIWLILLVASLTITLVAVICSTILLAAIFGGFAALLHGIQAVPLNYLGSFLVNHIAELGVGTVLVLLVVLIGAAYVYSLLATICELAAMHAMGVWFSRFEVNRWGVSSDPLPKGVPVSNEEMLHHNSATNEAFTSGFDEMLTSSEIDQREFSVRTPRGDEPYWDDEMSK